MGRGRKKQTFTLKEESQPSWKVNCSVTARNLRKSDLGGVIFGCKHQTIKECYSKQLFGLPAPHFAYVRNIDPGLMLFLFNYSDRKLHGIFEATSLGQMNINPHGWTEVDSESTPYPAQVRIQFRMQCQPLLEDQFKPIIADNYYEQRLFWFELDRVQTGKLIDMFSSSPVVSTSFSQNTAKWSTLFKTLPSPTRQEAENSETLALEAEFAQPDASNTEWGSSWDAPGWGRESQLLQAPIDEEAADIYQQEDMHLKPNYERSYSSVVRNMSTSLPQKKWVTLFKTLSVSETRKGNKGIKTSASEVNFPHLDQSNVELDSSCDAPCLEEEIQLPEASADEEAPCVTPLLDREIQALEALADEDTTEIPEEELAHSSSMTEDSEENDEEDIEVHLEDNCAFEASMDLKMKSSSLGSIVAKLMLEMEDLKTSHLQQIQKVSSLEQELIESKEEIQWLKDRCKVLESGSSPSIAHAENTEFELLNEPHLTLSGSIYIVGGYDGSSSLSDLDLYSPSQDLMNTLRPMSFARSHASAAKLNGELYILGGVDGKNLWYDTVESYNPSINQWVIRPSLNQRRGSLAGASLNNKIFAIGGANGVECFSDVEMFDPDIGRWIPTRSMLDKRFAPAAAEINGMIYVVGGYDGKYYSKSVERLDPREHSWTRLESMSSRRGCHSLAVLNEKLYALGGYDGARMVPTVEVFDPRIGAWMIGESMNDSRGYSAAVVIGQSIYVIGGVKDSSEEIVNTVECYKEGHGWQVTNLKGVGKRCFFSAIVL